MHVALYSQGINGMLEVQSLNCMKKSLKSIIEALSVVEVYFMGYGSICTHALWVHFKAKNSQE